MCIPEDLFLYANWPFHFSKKWLVLTVDFQVNIIASPSSTKYFIPFKVCSSRYYVWETKTVECSYHMKPHSFAYYIASYLLIYFKFAIFSKNINMEEGKVSWICGYILIALFKISIWLLYSIMVTSPCLLSWSLSEMIVKVKLESGVVTHASNTSTCGDTLCYNKRSLSEDQSVKLATS